MARKSQKELDKQIEEKNNSGSNKEIQLTQFNSTSELMTSQTFSQHIQQNISIPPNIQIDSSNFNQFSNLPFEQPDKIHNVQIKQNMNVQNFEPKEQQSFKYKRQIIKQSVPPSLNQNIFKSIIPDREHAYQEGNKIIHSNNWGRSTIAFNPVVSSGIVIFEGFFEKHTDGNFMIGIADSSAVFNSGECPFEDENEKNTICYYKDGDIFHIDPYIHGNSPIEENQLVSCEVNMNIKPRTLTFFYDNQEQPNSIINIPSSIRFFIYLSDENSSFTSTRFENIKSSSAKVLKGSRKFEWGEKWKE